MLGIEADPVCLTFIVVDLASVSHVGLEKGRHKAEGQLNLEYRQKPGQ